MMILSQSTFRDVIAGSKVCDIDRCHSVNVSMQWSGLLKQEKILILALRMDFFPPYPVQTD